MAEDKGIERDGAELEAMLEGEDGGVDAAPSEDIEKDLEQSPDDMKPQTFTVRGHVCEIRYSRKRIDLYEERHTPIIASFYKNDGMFTFKELAAITGYGLKVQDGAYFVPSKGEEVAGKLIEANGYAAVFQAVMVALQRDCAFLFMGAGN